MMRNNSGNLARQKDRSQWHHGGDLRHFATLAGCAPEELLDFSANMNPLGPPDWLRPTIDAHVDQVLRYPDPHCEALSQAAAERFGLNPDNLVWGNGASQLLFLLPKVLAGKRALIPAPCYSDYEPAVSFAGYTCVPLQMDASEQYALNLERLAASLAEVDLVVLGRPNNPTGHVPEKAPMKSLMARHPKTIFIVDEAFIDFLEDHHSLIDADLPNLIVVRSMTKFFCIPGLRLGFAVTPSEIAEPLRR